MRSGHKCSISINWKECSKLWLCRAAAEFAQQISIFQSDADRDATFDSWEHALAASVAVQPCWQQSDVFFARLHKCVQVQWYEFWWHRIFRFVFIVWAQGRDEGGQRQMMITKNIAHLFVRGTSSRSDSTSDSRCASTRHTLYYICFYSSSFSNENLCAWTSAYPFDVLLIRHKQSHYEIFELPVGVEHQPIGECSHQFYCILFIDTIFVCPAQRPERVRWFIVSHIKCIISHVLNASSAQTSRTSYWVDAVWLHADLHPLNNDYSKTKKISFRFYSLRCCGCAAPYSNWVV